MIKTTVLKAIADETRMELLTMLLKNNCCVRALARRLEMTEAAVSQHLKILYKAGLLTREMRGHFTYYDVERNALRELAGELESLATIKRVLCTLEQAGCKISKQNVCHDMGSNCGGCCGNI